MKKFWIVLLCLLLLSGCGKARASISLQEQYAAVTEAELTAQITCHLTDGIRQYQVRCTYCADSGSEIVITAPDELAGIRASVTGDELALSYDDLTLSAGVATVLSPVNCLPWLLRSAATAYVLEEGRENLEGRECLRLAFDTTGPDGEKVLCTAWFDQKTLYPVYSEFSQNTQLQISVKIISFTAKTQVAEGP